MKLRLFFLPVLLLIAAQTSPLALTAPRPGDVLRGEVTITGITEVPNFVSAQLDFTYASNATGNWFPLQTFSQPQPDSALLTWNTAAITDGEYLLRLQVFLADGTTEAVTVPITIQNDTLPVTPTAIPPTATAESIFGGLIPTPFLLAASPTPTDVPRPTPTPLPANPMALSQNEILLSLGRGALVIIGLFIFSGILIRLRRS